jgi:hypothetical protein
LELRRQIACVHRAFHTGPARELAVFYRLLAIDGRPLPTDAHIDGRPYRIYEGGLLLEPPSRDAEEGSPPEGHAILTLFGPRDSGDPVDGFLASAGESYRWTAEGELDVSRSWAASPTRFLGRVQGEQLQLRVAGASRFLSEATELGFVAAPSLPIRRAGRTRCTSVRRTCTRLVSSAPRSSAWSMRSCSRRT